MHITKFHRFNICFFAKVFADTICILPYVKSKSDIEIVHAYVTHRDINILVKYTFSVPFNACYLPQKNMLMEMKMYK